MASTMLPYGRQSISDEDIAAVEAILRGDWLTTGPAVTRFEDAISAFVGGGVSALSVTSGTAALHVAYAAAGIGPGSRVVTTPLTFVATASAAVLLGAQIDFADIDPVTGNLDLDAAAAMIGPDTRAIAAVDYAGLPVDGVAFQKLAHDADAIFIEDAAHSIGSTIDGRAVGTQADLTTFSFFPTKNLTTAEGGAVVTADAELARKAASFRNHGLVRDAARLRNVDEGPWHQEVHSFGLNYRLPDVLAALGSTQLGRLVLFKQRRAAIWERYSEAFAGVAGLTTPVRPDGADPCWHLYPLRVPADERRRIFERLRGDGIGVQVNYIPAYWHPVFEDLGYRRGACPNAEAYYAQEISLPMFYDLADSDVDRVIEAVLRAVA